MDYGIRIKRESPFAMTIVSCITNGSFVYLPTTKAFEQGGYEAGSSKYDPSVEDSLVGGLLAALDGLYRAN